MRKYEAMIETEKILKKSSIMASRGSLMTTRQKESAGKWMDLARYHCIKWAAIEKGDSGSINAMIFHRDSHMEIALHQLQMEHGIEEGIEAFANMDKTFFY